MAVSPLANPFFPWELAAENIAVKIRWFGLLVGYLIVNTATENSTNLLILNGILTLGLGYALFDTFFSFKGRIFLQRFPLLVSLMEAIFIGLLCYYHDGMDSPFRYYYLLSLICCAIRYSPFTTYITFAFHSGSYCILFLALPSDQRTVLSLVLTLVLLAWVTWASTALADLLKRVGEHLKKLNNALQENQTRLEARIEERTNQLQEAQALVLHQEKMAALGLLSAGIAHEVGNPLTSISSLVQILQKRKIDEYTQQKLGLVSGELKRIQTTLRELINFSRPAKAQNSLTSVEEIVSEALNICKYYKRTNGRRIQTRIPKDLPLIYGKRDLLIQVILNLVLNAIDATSKGGDIFVEVDHSPKHIKIGIEDTGSGIASENLSQIFKPYFTTKSNGTGLGLFVSQKLIAEHDGELVCKSVLGEGTRFDVILPVQTMPKKDLGRDIPVLREKRELPLNVVEGD